MHVAASNKIAEVIEASSAAIKAQCYRLYEAPPLGAFVRAGSPGVYGVVCNVATGPLDAGRRVIARGAEEESEEALYRANPQLERLLATTFEALVVGYLEGDAPRQSLPPLPPRVHAFVFLCAPEEVARFTASMDFLRLLLGSGLPTADQVVAACLRSAAACHREPQEFLLRAGRALARELPSDVARLGAILRSLAR